MWMALMAVMAIAVSAQVPDASAAAPAAVDAAATDAAPVPAIMTKPAKTLTKPIIFSPTPAVGSVDVDAPLFGAPPANLKKANVSENIYGGVIEFTKGRDHHGCKCRKQLPEKFRYDAQFKPDAPVLKFTKCGCPIKAAKPEDKLPPVIASLYPKRHHHHHNSTNSTGPCPKPKAPVVQKIAPAYYPKRAGPRALAKAAALAAAPCPKPVAAAPATITPSFYPTRSERRSRRKARRAAKKAGKKGKKKL